MVFSSLVFLFLFLPTALVLYYLFFAPSLGMGRRSLLWRRLSNLILLLASLFFYAWGESWMVTVMVGSTAVDFLCGLLIGAEGKASGSRAKVGLGLSILSGILLLGYFKYFNFSVDNYNGLVSALGLEHLQWREALKVALPLGVSFYKFQSISYTIDVYRGEVRPTGNVVDFFCYVTMFPQLVAGPIVRYVDVANQLVQRTMSLDQFASGASRFVFGLAKKVLIANSAALIADRAFGMPPDRLSAAGAWFGVTAYTIQIYFDFSGYSDMAIGIGRMLGFRFPENFNYPYIARSIQEFWRRWHISLSTWFRDYVYISLGGNRKGVFRTCFNLMTVFFLCGLWHGASWTFVVWGLYHGLFLVVERAGLGRILARTHPVPRHLYCLLVVMGGWVLFRAEGFGNALAYYKAMLGLGPAGRPFHLESYGALCLILGGLFSAPLVPWCRAGIERLLERSGPLRPLLDLATGLVRATSLAGLLYMSALLLSGGAHNPFIYFRF